MSFSSPTTWSRASASGVAYLEMAREAALRMDDAAAEAGEIGVRLTNTVWVRPALAEDGVPLELRIALIPDDDGGRLAFEIYSGADENRVHSQGSAELFPLPETEHLDLERLRSQCDRGVLTGAACYAEFAAAGLSYGPAHRVIEAVHLGEGQALARLALPDAQEASLADYVLHPGLADGALQAIAALKPRNDEAGGGKPSLPFAVDEVEILRPCAARMWSVARFTSGSGAGDAVQKFDIDLCANDGAVCARLRGFSTRTLDGAPDHATAPATLLFEPAWRSEPVAAGQAPEYAERLTLICGVTADAAELAERLGWRCETLPADDYAAQAERLLAELQALQSGGASLIQVVTTSSGPQQLSAGLTGMLRTARLEIPKLTGQMICVEPDEDTASLAAKLAENARTPHDAEIRYTDGAREVAGWRELAAAPEAAPAQPWRADGVYMITGGLGGLGLIFAREIAEQAPGATLVLTGRRELDDAGRQSLRELEALGARPEYHSVDVADRATVEHFLLQIQEDHGGL
ncbi:MAG: polyketide synthase dehydratase domain-containing protein, partial [Alphaproteobacteria bacterium]